MTTVSEVWKIAKPRVAKYDFKVDCVNPELIIGMELETEKLSHNIDYTGIAKACNINIERDGSLRGASAEFTTKPMMTMNCLAAVRDFFDQTKATEANYSDRCSTHVHVNCTDMELEQVGGVALIYTILEDILFDFVGKYRDTNIYCVPWNQCRLHYNLISSFLEYPQDQLRAWNKYTALNLIPLSAYGTVEFRQMHGTRDMQKLTTWVNIIGGIFAYAKSVGLKDLIERVKSFNTLSHYEAFFNQATAGQLPYNEDYRRKLEEGVIFAKYSLAGYGKEKRNPMVDKIVEQNARLDDMLRDLPVGDTEAQAPQAAVDPRALLNEMAQNRIQQPMEIRVPEAFYNEAWQFPAVPAPRRVPNAAPIRRPRQPIREGGN